MKHEKCFDFNILRFLIKMHYSVPQKVLYWDHHLSVYIFKHIFECFKNTSVHLEVLERCSN